MEKNFLPLGSVVLLKDATKKLMITGYCIENKDNQNQKFDYCGCLYPIGIIDTNKIAAFNHDQIDTVYFTGYQTDEMNIILNELKKADKNNETKNN